MDIIEEDMDQDDRFKNDIKKMSREQLISCLNSCEWVNKFKNWMNNTDKELQLYNTEDLEKLNDQDIAKKILELIEKMPPEKRSKLYQRCPSTNVESSQGGTERSE